MNGILFISKATVEGIIEMLSYPFGLLDQVHKTIVLLLDFYRSQIRSNLSYDKRTLHPCRYKHDMNVV